MRRRFHGAIKVRVIWPAEDMDVGVGDDGDVDDDNTEVASKSLDVGAKAGARISPSNLSVST